MKNIGWKVSLATIFSVLLFTSFIYNLDALAYLNLDVEQTYIKVYVCSTIFHFVLAVWLLTRFKASFFLFIVCIAPHLIIDAQVLYENVLVPLRAPFATIFPVLGTALAFIYKKGRKPLFIGAFIGSIAFLFLSWKVLIPKMAFSLFVNKLPKNTGVLGREVYKTITGDPVAIEDTARNKVLLLEWYFVGCPPCEEKYKALKQLADTFKNKQLDIVMICAGTVTKFDKFQNHANKNAYSGITFLYDGDSISNRFCKDGIQGFPTEFLSKRYQKPEPSFLGFDKDIYKMYLENEIKKIKNLLSE
jgi:AhpC/TSA family